AKKWAQQANAAGVYLIKNKLENEGLLLKIVSGILNRQSVDKTIASQNIIIRSYVASNQDKITQLSSWPPPHVRGSMSGAVAPPDNSRRRGGANVLTDLSEELYSTSEEGASEKLGSEEETSSMPPLVPESAAMPSTAEFAPAAPPERP